jgi:hypothetical protein
MSPSAFGIQPASLFMTPPRALAALLLSLVVTSPAISQTTTPPADGPSITAALRDSLSLLAVEHGVRIAFQSKTRRELEGPFWGDYTRSLRMPEGWEDDDNWIVNYIGHPIHGAAAGLLWTEHDPVSRDVEFGLDARYWATRWRPLTWSAIYSVQFEVGPISEASIGNVGLKPNTIGWVDYVVTPVGGMGLAIAEDALDKFFVEWFERRVGSPVFRAIVRGAVNPARTMANVSAGHLPWYRRGRPLKWKHGP